MLKNVNLYGGAITCQIPENFMDLSDYLPVPDNQEVFVRHLDDNVNISKNEVYSKSDVVLSFEILEYLQNVSDFDIGRFLFEDLSNCNESRNTLIHSCTNFNDINAGLPSPCKGVFITGTMEVSKSKFKHLDSWTSINIFMYNIRLPKYKSEFMITYNYPSGLSNDLNDEQKNIFQHIINTLRITDDKLFKFNQE